MTRNLISLGILDPLIYVVKIEKKIMNISSGSLVTLDIKKAIRIYILLGSVSKNDGFLLFKLRIYLCYGITN